jgi:hypothetical protein
VKERSLEVQIRFATFLLVFWCFCGCLNVAKDQNFQVFFSFQMVGFYNDIWFGLFCFSFPSSMSFVFLS